MMTVTLTPELERAIEGEARKRGVTPEDAALAALREKFLPETPFGGSEDNLTEWELEISAAALQVDAALAEQRKDTP